MHIEELCDTWQPRRCGEVPFFVGEHCAAHRRAVKDQVSAASADPRNCITQLGCTYGELLIAQRCLPVFVRSSLLQGVVVVDWIEAIITHDALRRAWQRVVPRYVRDDRDWLCV